MTELTQWVRTLVGSALICACALSLTPEGRVKKVTRLACGAVCVLALISPLYQADGRGFSADLAHYRALEQQLAQEAEDTARALERTVIQQQCAAYIWDKAEQLGLKLTAAEVSVKWSDEGYWYPDTAEITAPAGQNTAGLSAAIAAELGIDRTRQRWSEE